MKRIESLAEALRLEDGLTDYVARRGLLHDLEAVPWEDWCAICAEADAIVGEPDGRHRYAAVWLWEELTSSDYRDAAGLRGRPHHQRYSYTRKFVPRHLPTIEQPLRHYGQRLLADA